MCTSAYVDICFLFSLLNAYECNGSVWEFHLHHPRQPLIKWVLILAIITVYGLRMLNTFSCTYSSFIGEWTCHFSFAMLIQTFCPFLKGFVCWVVKFLDSLLSVWPIFSASFLCSRLLTVFLLYSYYILKISIISGLTPA